MIAQIATSPCPQLRDHLVSSRSDARVQPSPLDPLPRDHFDWCLGPRTVALYEAILPERVAAGAKAGWNESAISWRDVDSVCQDQVGERRFENGLRSQSLG